MTNVRVVKKEDEAKRLTLYSEGLSDYEIADIVGVARATIQKWRIRRGLKANYPVGRPRKPRVRRRREDTE